MQRWEDDDDDDEDEEDEDDGGIATWEEVDVERND